MMESASITKESLSDAEKKTFDSLVRLGDSERLALWTIENVDRKNRKAKEVYRSAYCS